MPHITTVSTESDSSDGPVFRQEYLDHLVQHDDSPPSPRTELLSDSDSTSPNPQRLVERHHRRKRSAHSRRKRELAYSRSSSQELIGVIISQEREIDKLRDTLHMAYDRLQEEARRAADVERMNRETAQRFRILNDSRLSAMQEARVATEQLRMYKLQLETAQLEIQRAQRVLQMVEKQKDDAEDAAARARTKARKLTQERLVESAREAGRRSGYDEGFQHAQEEFGIEVPLREEEPAPPRHRRQHAERPPTAQEQEEQEEEIYTAPPPSHVPLRLTDTYGSPQVIRMPEPAPVAPSETIVPPAPLQSQNHNPAPEPQPEPQRMESPAIQVYQVDVPPAEPASAWATRARPPDNYIPPSTFDGSIPVPPPHEFADRIPQQARPADTTSQSTARTGGSRSWYRPREVSSVGVQQQGEARPPRTRDYAFPQRQASLESGSASTRLSQLDLVSPPNQTPAGSATSRSVHESATASRRPREQERERERGLSVIDEEASRHASPAGVDRSVSLDSGVRAGMHRLSRGSGEYTRRGEAETRPVDPPRRVRRPSVLSVPAPLAPQSAPMRPPSGSSNRSSQPQQQQQQQQQPRLRRVPAAHEFPAPEINIGIEPPSQSPSETTPVRSQGNDFLTPAPAVDYFHYQHQHPYPQSDGRYVPRPAPSTPPSEPFIPPLHSTATVSSRSSSPSPPLPIPFPATRTRTRSSSGARTTSTPPPRMVPPPGAPPTMIPPPVAPVMVPPPRTRAAAFRHSPEDDPDTYVPRYRPSAVDPDGTPSVMTPSPLLPDDARLHDGSTPYVTSHELPVGEEGGGEGADALARIPSNASLRSAGSFGHFEPGRYLDPAYYGADDPALPVRVSMTPVPHP
ncbi:hypothetical protein BD779DRAFT_1681100 [Infundibulicybe gibba]|nr:hypothetical protein BD779DRAFT_1681100 [Infundibulicybe gibba]